MNIFAQRSLEVPLPGLETSQLPLLSDYVKYIFNFSIGISGFIVFAVLIYGGFRYLTSAGNPSVMSDAKDRIFSALLGLVVLLGSYLILTTINPQLILLLRAPQIEFFEKEQPTQPIFPEKDTLAYSEIPIGGLIGKLFSKERIAGVGDVSENIQKISEEVLKKSQELNSFAGQCACSLAQSGCGGSCSGGACAGEPCPARNKMNQKREETQSILSVSENSLEEWQKKLNIEINGSPEGAEVESLGFREIYEDLKKAEEEIKNCPLTTSKAGRPQVLLTYSNFWEYRRRLEEEQKIKGVELSRPFNYILPDNAYSSATFYCAEYLGQIFPVGISGEKLSQEFIIEIEKNFPEELTAKQTKEPICGPEITIGQAIDNAQELAQKILTDLAIINDNISEEISAGQKLIKLADPKDCSAGSCQTQCTWVRQQCWRSEPCPEEGSLLPGEGWWNWFFFSPSSNFVFAQGEENCGRYVDCSYCDIRPCSGSVCPGDPALNSQISSAFSGIQNSASRITSSQEDVKNIIRENNIEDKFKMSKILEDLNSNQEKLRVCYNSKEIQEKAERGERVFWQRLNSCSAIKQSVGTIASFYNEDGEELKDCYGSAPETPDLFDDYFCCQSELFKQ